MVKMISSRKDAEYNSAHEEHPNIFGGEQKRDS